MLLRKHYDIFVELHQIMTMELIQGLLCLSRALERVLCFDCKWIACGRGDEVIVACSGLRNIGGFLLGHISCQ